MKKLNENNILIIGSTNLAVFKLRSELINRLKDEGFNIGVAFQSGDLGDGPSLSKMYGCDFFEVPIDRRGKNPFNDLILLFTYIKILKKFKPSYVLTYNVKCNIYGGIACRLLNIPFMPNITGLGKGMVEGNILRFITSNLYKIAVKKSKCIFFQNERDKEFFDSCGIKYSKFVILPGSGVNLDEFKVLPFPQNNKTVFLFIARVMRTKGIDEYLAAAKYFKDNNLNAEFQICGYCEENYQALLKDYADKKIIVYNGLVNNVSKFIKKADCIVLPSFHPEGISNVLLEGSASGRPIITTDNVGCRETVIDGVSGFLVKKMDSNDLIDKLLKFYSMSFQNRKKMGLEARRHIENNFDRNIVVDYYLNNLREK